MKHFAQIANAPEILRSSFFFACSWRISLHSRVPDFGLGHEDQNLQYIVRHKLHYAEHFYRGANYTLLRNTGQVGIPALLLVLLGSIDRVGRGVDATTGDNEVGTTADCRLRSLVLLAELIALGRKVDTGGEDNEVLVLRRRNARIDLAQRAGRHKAQHEAGVLAGDVDGGRGVRARGEGALGGHFCEDEEAALGAVGERGVLGGLGEGFDDALTRQDGAVDDVGPFGNAEGAVVVLLLDGVADVDELAVFEDKEVVLGGEGVESVDRRLAEV